jgi:hypothetical protein
MSGEITFRDSLRKLSPRWLQGAIGGRLLYSMAVQMDALADACVEAVKLRYPGAAPSEALSYIGRDRRMSRGIAEPDDTYAARLRGWLDAHAGRGGPYAMLAQIRAHYLPTTFSAQLVYRSGRRYSMDTSGVVTVDTIPFDINDVPEKWARFWLFYAWPFPVDADGTWDSAGLWDDGGVWDSTLSSLEVADLRLVPREWSAAHAQGVVVLLSSDRELWDYPAGTWSDPGVWETFGPAEMAIG